MGAQTMSEDVTRCKMSDLRQYTQKFLTEFIELYKFHPALWQIKNRDYRDKTKKAAAYEVLVKKCKEVEPECDKDTVVKKINSLRTCYRKEFKKVQASLKTNEPYKPKLWYYELLGFLNDESLLSESSVLYVDEDVSSDYDPFFSQNESVITDSPSTSTFMPLEKIKRRRDDFGEPFQMPAGEDEFDLLGKVYANKLRKLATEQRIYAEKLINDTFFEAELGNLNRHCCLDTSNTKRLKSRPHNQISTELDVKSEYMDPPDS